MSEREFISWLELLMNFNKASLSSEIVSQEERKF